MKRRSFLKAMGLSAVAAPAAAQQVAQAALVDPLTLSGGLGTLGISGLADSGGFLHEVGEAPSPLHATNVLSLLRSLTSEQMHELRRRTHVDRLDPDIAAYRSFSMSAKIAAQRERNLQANLAFRRSRAERLMLGKSFDELDIL